MRGMKMLKQTRNLLAVAVGSLLSAGAAQAGGVYFYSAPAVFPLVAGTIYTPVPVGAYYAPVYQYVTPAAHVTSGTTAESVTKVQAIEPVPTPAGGTPVVETAQATTIAPVPVLTTPPVYSAPPVYTVAPGYVSTYYTPVPAPVYVTPVRVVPAPRVYVAPRRGVVRIRY